MICFRKAFCIGFAACIGLGLVSCSEQKPSEPALSVNQNQHEAAASTEPPDQEQTAPYMGEIGEWQNKVPKPDVDEVYYCRVNLHSPTEVRLRTFALLMDAAGKETTVNLVPVTSAKVEVEDGTTLTASKDPSDRWLSVQLPSPVSPPVETTVSLEIVGYDNQVKRFTLPRVVELNEDTTSTMSAG